MTNFPSHIQWIIDNLGEQFQAALLAEQVYLETEQAVSILLQADPSESKRAVDWLIKSYLTGGFLWEDVAGGKSSKVSETLMLFAQYRNNLVGNSRNLQNYGKISEVWAQIKSFIPNDQTELSQSGRAKRKKDREIAISQSRMLYKSKDLIVAVPLTQEAAQWWGRGTRWCTAARSDEESSNNLFASYNRVGPLVNIVLPKGLDGQGVRKFQLWFDTRGERTQLSFMDENDSEVAPETVFKSDQFKPIIDWAFSHNSDFYRFINYKDVDREVIDRMLSGGNYDLWSYNIPRELLTREDYTRAVGLNGYCISNLDPTLLDQEICNLAFAENSFCVKSIPIKFITDSMVIKVLSEDHSNMFRIVSPITYNVETKITDELCWQALYSSKNAIYNIPDKFLKTEMFAYAIEHYEIPYHRIPSEFRTLETAIVALKKNCRQIDNINSNLIESSQECVDILLKDSRITRYLYKIPDKYKDYDFWKKVAWVSDDLFVTQKIPKEFITRDILSIVLSKSSGAIKRIPSRFLDDWSLQQAVKSHGIALEWITPKHKTLELCMIAIEQNPLAIEWVPKKFLTAEISGKAVERNGMALCHVPKKHLTRDLCALAFKQNPACITRIPSKWITWDMCKQAIPVMDGVLSWIPEQFITAEMATLALDAGHYSISHLEEWGLLTKELAQKAACLYPDALILIPNNMIDKTVILNSIQHSIRNLLKCPDGVLSAQDVLDIIEKDAKAIQSVPVEFWNNEFRVQALNVNPKVENFLEGRVKNQVKELKLIQDYGTGTCWPLEILDGLECRFEAVTQTEEWEVESQYSP